MENTVKGAQAPHRLRLPDWIRKKKVYIPTLIALGLLSLGVGAQQAIQKNGAVPGIEWAVDVAGIHLELFTNEPGSVYVAGWQKCKGRSDAKLYVTVLQPSDKDPDEQNRRRYYGLQNVFCYQSPTAPSATTNTSP